MSTLFPFSVALPSGINLAVLMVFILLGTTSVFAILLRGQSRYTTPVLFHIAGGVLAVLAHDLMTLLVAWEVLTFSAFLLIRGTGAARGRHVALRYLVIHLIAAVFFFFAALVHFGDTGSLAVEILSPAAQPFMLVAVLIKTATFPVHFWLVDAYPSVHPAITPLLSVFTTKVGVITMAQLLRISPAGYPIVAWFGAGTAVIAVIFALAQHNARRLLSFHIVSQVGYMVAGIGLAAGWAASGLTAGTFHLVTHTLYKALLLLVAAQIIYDTNREDLTRIEGPRFSRPVLLACGVIGALAISGVPFTSGYASKYLLKEAARAQPLVYSLLQIASVGTGLSFIKFIYLSFFNTPKITNPAAAASRKNRPAEVLGEGASIRSGGASPVGTATRPATARQNRLAETLPLLVVAVVTVLIGVFPHHVPGVPDRDFFALSSLASALPPPAVSALLWILLRNSLTRPASPGSRSFLEREDSPVYLFVRAVAHRCAGVRWPARILHEQGPQVQVLVILLVFMATVLFLHVL